MRHDLKHKGGERIVLVNTAGWSRYRFLLDMSAEIGVAMGTETGAAGIFYTATLTTILPIGSRCPRRHRGLCPSRG